MTNEITPFPVPEDKVSLFDLDGTIIDHSYFPTDNELLLAAVQDTQAAGWHIGLSSDTPYEYLATWRQRFGMNGPIIAERGAVVEAVRDLDYSRKDAAKFAESRDKICELWRENGAEIWYGNPVEAIRGNYKIGQPGVPLVLVNVLRRCGIGVHIRQVLEDGKLMADTNLSESLGAMARPYYPEIDDIHEDLNHDYGVLIVSRESHTKRAGAKRLAEAMQIGKFAMVGNSISDYLGSDLAIHYAVGDATDEYKAVADYVSPKPLTSGAVDILKRMAEAS